MQTENFHNFKNELEKNYAKLFASDPEYVYAKLRTTPSALANKMTAGLLIGTANKDGHGIKLTCKHFNLKHTYGAIREFLRAGNLVDK